MTVLGVYWAPGHQRQADIEYMQRLQPPAIRVLDPDPNQLVIAHKAAPKALLLPRDWALSEQHDDARRDPVGTGKRHAQDWRGKINRWRAEGATLPPDNQIIVVGINEMQVWNMLPQAVEYTVAMLDECTHLGLRACALNLSVGWPANTGEGTPPDWKPYAPVEPAIKRGNHILTLHSYWYKSGPQDGAGWWAWRHHACPWDVPIIIGECGVDNYVDMQRWQNDGKPNRGWRGNISPDQYAAQMEQYARGCDTRVIAILPFLTDYRSNNWESFDTLEAHGALLARKDAMVPQAKFGTAPSPAPPPPPYVPTAGELLNPPKRGTVTATVLNIRSGPSTDYPVVAQLAHGDTVTVTAQAGKDSKWNQIGADRWVYSGWLRWDDVQPTPAPSVPHPEGSRKWQRTIAFILKEEGGYTPNDEGAPANFGINQGANPDLDVKNITREQAIERYRTGYWIASGADKLDWPFCLLVMDAAVQHGEGEARMLLKASKGNMWHFQGARQLYYANIANDKWQRNGKAWMARMGRLLLEASQ